MITNMTCSYDLIRAILDTGWIDILCLNNKFLGQCKQFNAVVLFIKNEDPVRF